MNIKSLAKHLNLSIGTVSRALNGRRYVDADTRERVIQAAAAFGYSPNQSARNLRQGTTGMIAMMLPASTKMSVADTIFMIVLDGLRAAFADRNLDLMILLCDLRDNGAGYLRRVVERRLADGVIIADIGRVDPRVDYLLEKKTPFVAFGRTEAGGPFPWIDFDFESVAKSAVARFVQLGHRRIALATTAEAINYGFVFEASFRDALKARNIPIEPPLIMRVEASEDGGYEFGERLLAMANRPTAALVANETMGVGLYRRLFEAGLIPGRDLSIIAFGEEPTARFLSPKPTYYASDLRGLGVALGEALLAVMPGFGNADAPPVQKLWPMHLVAGESDGVLIRPVRSA